MLTNLKTLALALAFLAIALIFAPAPAQAQTATTQTTASAAIASTDGTSSGAPICLTSGTGLVAAGGNNQINTEVVIDREAFAVINLVGTTCFTAIRGYDGTRAKAHNSGAVAWVGTPGPNSPFFSDTNYSQDSGTCVPSSNAVLPHIFLPSGNVVDCNLIQGSNSVYQWGIRFAGPVNEFTDGAFFVAPTACNSETANTTGTNGFTTVGASNLPAVQAQSSNSGTNTHLYTCTITVPTRLTAGRGVAITDVTFFYGVQTTALGTQVATLASGTMNSQLVFSKIVYPTAAASETASTVTPVRADAGSLVITPAVASFNTGTTTAGGFYSAKFTPATPIAMTTDLQQLIFSVALLNTATSATITNSPGLLVHWTAIPL